MAKTSKNRSDSTAQIRSHLEKKSKKELIALLLDLVKSIDEPTRQRFWKRMAPKGMATAELRYESAQVFLSELAEFASQVTEGEYFDEEAATYFGEGDYDDYDIYDEYEADEEYKGSEKYDPDSHAGVIALRKFFQEADSYFEAGQFTVAWQAYQLLLDIGLEDTFETLGIYDVFGFIDQDLLQVINRYLVAMKSSRPVTEFIPRALQFLTTYEFSEVVDDLLQLVGEEYLGALHSYLEAWAEQHAQVESEGAALPGLPLPLRLLLQLNDQLGHSEDNRAVWVRFRRLYPALFAPLLADRENEQDWRAILTFGEEALEFAHPPSHPYYSVGVWSIPDSLTLRGFLVRASSAIGDAERAFHYYKPAFSEAPSFETYSQARLLADAVSREVGESFTRQVTDTLRKQGDRQRYLLCQVYLSESRFEEAYSLVEKLSGYQGLEESKLVAKAHLLAALGPTPDEAMGSNLRELYASLEAEEKEPMRFLRITYPHMVLPPRPLALERAQNIYFRLMQAHVDNGRKTYSVGAYYCALLAEIAAHEGHLPAFREWYEGYMETYKRFRALRAEMDAKIGPVLHGRSASKW